MCEICLAVVLRPPMGTVAGSCGSRPARALWSLRRPPHRRHLVADRWLGALSPCCPAGSCRRPSISHVIPQQLVQTLNVRRWDCNVFVASRKVTVGNYVRNLCGGGPANACWPCQPAAARTAAGSCDSSGVFRTSGVCCAVVACPDSASHSVQNSPCLVLC